MTKNLKVKLVAFDFPVILASDTNAGGFEQNNWTDTAEIQDSNNPFNIRAKYADKIRMKLAKQAITQQNINLKAKVMIGTSTRWLLAEGMGDILDYTFSRTVKLGLLGGYDQPNSIVEQLKAQLNQTKLSYIRKDTKIDEKHPYHSTKFVTKQALVHMEHSMQVSKGNVLLVSGNEDFLTLGKERGYFTCRYR
jgi:hypothetical protein